MMEQKWKSQEEVVAWLYLELASFHSFSVLCGSLIERIVSDPQTLVNPTQGYGIKNTFYHLTVLISPFRRRCAHFPPCVFFWANSWRLESKHKSSRRISVWVAGGRNRTYPVMRPSRYARPWQDHFKSFSVSTMKGKVSWKKIPVYVQLCT